jgi:hypothetical protein
MPELWETFSFSSEWGSFVFDGVWDSFSLALLDPIEPAFRYLLLQDSNVSQMVADRIYIGNRPQDHRQICIVINLISEDDTHTLDAHGGYFTGRMQVDCLASTAKDAARLAIAAKWALDSESGLIAGCNVDWIKSQSRRRLPMEPLEGQASPTYGMSLDCTFMYEVT